MTFQKSLEGDKYVTSSLVLTMVSKVREDLTASIEQFQVTDPSMAAFGRELLNHEKSGFNKYFGDSALGSLWSKSETRGPRNRRKGISHICLVASALDPRTKNLAGLDDDEQEKVWSIVKKEMELAGGDVARIPEPIVGGGNMDLAFLDDGSDDGADVQMVEEGLSIEDQLRLYKCHPKIFFKDPPLVWWAQNQKSFPLVAKVARKFLCIPATSASSERVFSVAGRVIEKRRNRLTGNNAEDLIFLHESWDNCCYDEDEDVA